MQVLSKLPLPDVVNMACGQEQGPSDATFPGLDVGGVVLVRPGHARPPFATAACLIGKLPATHAT